MTVSRTLPRLVSLRRILLILAVLAALGLAGAGRADATQVAAVQAHFMWSQYSTSDIATQMDQAKAAGAGMLRVDVGWSSIEQDGKGQLSSWYLSKLDTVVNDAQARGLRLLLTYWQTPCWASSAPATLKQNCSGSWWDRDVQLYPPSNPQDYADSLAFLVKRYGDRVAAWEVWNEPNQDDYYKSSDPAGTYAALLRAAYPAAKAADPNTTIVGGSLADSDFNFTQALYDRGVKGYFDAWSIHPYSADRSPLDPAGQDYAQNSFVRGVPAVRDTMLHNGDDKPLWLTEFGWSTCDVRGAASWQNCVDPSVQATYLTQAFEEMRTWSYVPVGVWFNLENTSSDPSSRIDNYGLLNADGTPKPAFAAFKAAAADLANGPLTASPTPPSGTQTGGTRKQSIKLRVRRRSGVVYASGRGPARTRVYILSFRYDQRRHRVATRPTYRTVVTSDATGKFAHRLSGRRLAVGRWRIKAQAASPAVRAASKRLS